MPGGGHYLDASSLNVRQDTAFRVFNELIAVTDVEKNGAYAFNSATALRLPYGSEHNVIYLVRLFDNGI